MWRRRYIRRVLIITSVIIVMGLGLTGCMKVTEKTDDVEAASVEAEDLPSDGEEDGADTVSGKAENGETSEEKNLNDGDAPAFHYVPDEDGDLYGDIYEVGDMQFTVIKVDVFTDKTDDGREAAIMVESAVGHEEEAEKIKIVYDENTAFEKQKIWDAGAGHEEREGTAADLQKGFSVEMWGSYEGDAFHATAIKIVEVILE